MGDIMTSEYNNHTITFRIGDDGVEDLKFDELWDQASSFYKWDHLNDIKVIMDSEYIKQGREFESENTGKKTFNG